MPRTSYEWDGIDAAAARRMDQIIADSEQSNAKVSEHLGNRVSYSRIRDIRRGLKAPIRLSEFVGICRACGVDPVRMLEQIIDDSVSDADTALVDPRNQQILEHLRAAIQLAEDGDDADRKSKALSHMRKSMDLAAYRSAHKDAYIDGDAT